MNQFIASLPPDLNRVSAALHRKGMEIRFGIVLLVLLLVTTLAYWPGLTGPFVLDDYSNLVALGENGGVDSWANVLYFVLGNDSGPTGRPVSMLTFLLDAQDWPPHIAALKYTNIMIHLLTGLVLCWFAYLLFQALHIAQSPAVWLALLVAAFWLLHPLNSTTTMYIVQRMTQLMTLFALLSLIFYIKGRETIRLNPRRGSIFLAVALFPFALLSVLSKENGAMLLLLFVVMEYSIFRNAEKPPLFKLWYHVGVLLPLSIVVAYLLLTLPTSLEGYAYRHFDLGQRLLTEARILCTYLARIFFPTTLGAGLYHDDIVISTSLLQPITTLLSLAALFGLSVLALCWRKSHPMFLFGLGWFFSMQLLESTYLPLELYFEHRNYISMIGPLLAAAWYLHVFLDGEHTVAVKNMAKFGLVGLLLFMTSSIWQTAMLWGNTGDLHAYWAFEKPESSRAKIAYAGFLAQNDNPEAAISVLQQAQALHPNEVTLMLHTWNTACANGVESPVTLEEIADRNDLEYKHNDIILHLQELLENAFSGACPIPSAQTFVKLFETIGDIPMSDRRRASYHFLFSDLYISLRQLDPALVQLSQAFRLRTTPEIPYRQAILSASAGNYADALVFLERARAANTAQSRFMPSMEPLIAQMQADIERRLDSAN